MEPVFAVVRPYPERLEQRFPNGQRTVPELSVHCSRMVDTLFPNGQPANERRGLISKDAEPEPELE